MVAENTTRRVDIILSAKDNASVTLDRASMNVRRLKAEASESLVYGPAVKPRFGDFEQEARDIAAGKLRAMRDAARRANVRERADEILFGPSDSSEGEQKRAAALAGAEAGEGYSKGFIETLKKSFGKGSALKESLEVLKGGGAILGFTLVGEVLARTTERLKDFSHEMHEGKMSAAEITAKLGQSLPIIGGFVTAGQNIREIITGEQYEIDQIMRTAEAVNRTIDANRRGVELTTQSLKEMADTAERMERAAIIAPLRGAERDRATAYADEADREQKIIQDNEGRVKAREAITNAAVGDLKNKMREAGNEAHAKELQAQIDAAQEQLKKDVATIRAALPGELQASYRLFQTNQQQADYQRKVDQAEKARQRETGLAAIGSSADDRISEINRATRREYLLAQGRTDEAQLVDIRADFERQRKALDDEVAAAREAEAEAERRKTAEYNRPGHTTESFQVELDNYADAQERTRTVVENANRVKAALNEQQRVKELAAMAQFHREQENQEHDHTQTILGIQASTAAESLRAMGRNAEAEELELREGLQRRLAEIKDTADKEKLIHAERAKDIDRRAQEDASAAADEFNVNMERMRRENADKFAPDRPSALGESRLLTGTLGEAMTNPLMQPVERTAKATETVADVAKKINDGIARLVQLFPSLGNQPQVLTAN